MSCIKFSLNFSVKSIRCCWESSVHFEDELSFSVIFVSVSSTFSVLLSGALSVSVLADVSSECFSVPPGDLFSWVSMDASSFFAFSAKDSTF